MDNATYIEHMRSIQQEVEPVARRLLKNICDAWGFQSAVQAIHAPFYDYGWYIEHGKVSIVLAINTVGDDPSPSALRLDLGKLTQAIPSLRPYDTLHTFPLTNDGFVAAIQWINEHGPGEFC